MNPRDPWQLARWIVRRSVEDLAARSLWLSPINGGLGVWCSASESDPPRSVSRPVYVTTVEASEALKANEPAGWTALLRIADRIATVVEAMP